VIIDQPTAPKSPYPWFGGKASIMRKVWKRFGAVRNFVDPFLGSLAPLLGRPMPFEGTETVNDADGFISNFWRAVAADPEATAFHADWPVNENDLHARHSWLVGQRESITAKLEGDPEWFDARVAGWWVWGCCCWIGSGWCSGNGPWHRVQTADGWELRDDAEPGQGAKHQLVHLGNAGRGVNRNRVHLGNAGQGVNRNRVYLGAGMPGTGGRGINSQSAKDGIYEWFDRLAARLKRVRVCCGDWTRVCGPTPTVKQGLTAVFLDPPYADTAGRDDRLYSVDSASIAHDVRAWAVAHGDDPDLRIALCGYEGEHTMPDSWECLTWKARGGYGSQGDEEETDGRANSRRERIWFSKFCLKPRRHRQTSLFDLLDTTA
jgi:hypothetical protein